MLLESGSSCRLHARRTAPLHLGLVEKAARETFQGCIVPSLGRVAFLVDWVLSDVCFAGSLFLPKYLLYSRSNILILTCRMIQPYLNEQLTPVDLDGLKV